MPRWHARFHAHEHHHPLRWHHRLAHSLKWRLVVLFLALAVGVTGVFVLGTREAFSTGWRELVRPLVTDYVDRLTQEIGSPPDVARAQAIVNRLPVSIAIDGPVVHWQAPAQRPPAPPPSARDRAWRSMLERQTADGHRIVFGVSTWRFEEHPPLWRWWPLAGLLVLTWLAFGYVRRLFRPLDDIRAGALRYGAGRFDAPIPVRRHDELGELATQVNAMAANLARMLEGQRALLLAISHELRSPLTRARLNAELVADGPERDALLRDLAQMRDLITDLLEGERLAGGHAALHREPTDLNAQVREAVAALMLSPAGEGREPPTLDLAGDLPTLPLDRARLALLLRNLLANALQHGQGSPVTVSTRRDGAVVELNVRDHGPGVADDQLDQLAQPFHRPDAARSRPAGAGNSGVGLGLYLCRLVAQGHGGELRIANARPGLVVSVQLPVAIPTDESSTNGTRISIK